MRIHFISIGGAVMHNMAIALHKKGYQVTGTDDEIYEPALSRLKNYDLLPNQFGWQPNLITQDIDAIILGMHARKDNPELARAQELGLKIYSFPEYMYEQTKDKLRIVVGGSHGKTTTTAMILHVLNYHNLEFDYLVGSQLAGFETMVGFSHTSKIAVFEGDEYLTSALDLRPKFHVYQANIGIITGIAWDHINVFPTYENYLFQFEKFIKDISKDGSIIYCESDPEVKKLLDQTETVCEKIPYTTPLFSVENGHFILPTSVTGEENPVSLSFFGTHNLQNMMAAKHACLKAGLNQAQFYEAIQGFKGTAKRLETIKETEHSLVLRDFAHAPSKLKATVNAVRELYPDRKLIAAYELHTYSSLNKDFLPHYHNTLEKADVRAVLFSKHALEIKKMPMLDPSEVAAGFGEDVRVFTDKNELRAFLEQYYTGNENLLLMSSGTFDGMSLEF
ncbi:MAG: peptidoglycan synthetase [Bacteroidia bacterium]|nr:peptidoglycan synthetase [Bacteroidia bacterium]MCF8427718.1 peptidoglycan synthetase [Bacteroidia bacterium]